MERRKAITAAAAASLTLLAGAAGIALNSGIVGANGDNDVGQLSPINTISPPITVYVDDPATIAVAPAPPVLPTGGQPVATSAASSYQDDDDRYEDEDDDRYEDEDDDDRYEFEGAEDDD